MKFSPMSKDLINLRAQYPQPDWNNADSVSLALEAVLNANDEKSSQAAYNKLLYSVGNNHAGTYYPVVLAIFSDIEKILGSGENWPQHTIIEVLIDLFTSFMPAPGQEMFNELPVSTQLRDHIIGLKGSVSMTATGTGKAAISAQDLLRHLNELDE